MTRLRPAAITAILALAAVSLFAQDPGYGGTGGMGRPGEWRDRPARQVRPLPTANELEGPPLPEFFVPQFELDSGQAGQYRAVYDSFMTATATIRDSARAARRAVDAAFQSGDRGSARPTFPLLRMLGDSLALDDAFFDQRLKGFLTKGQLKAYRKWKDEQRRQEDDARREEMDQRRGEP